MSQQEIIQLLDRYLAGTASLPEQERVELWLNNNEDLNNEWQRMDDMRRNEFLTSLYQRIKKSIGEEGRKEQNRYAKLIPLYRRKIFKYIAAASVILIASLIVILSLSKNDNGSTPSIARTNDVQAPANTRAVITLADGSKVYLDSAGNGTLANENGVDVVKDKEGAISYQPLAISQQPTAYNTLYNPRGSKVISLTLSDGTKVWLNSESSLKYPIAFAGNTREVEITGEAYFEVKHNSKQPFKVHLPNGSVIEDIGTAFNVNAYNDEDAIKTTLVEGAVKISASSAKASASSAFLKPGQQAVVSNPANPSILKILVSDNVDVEEVLAWKNGTFSYTNSDLETIMRQMARWYDVEVVYTDKITDRYTVDVPRTVPVSQLFHFIEMSGGVHFKIEGKKITVSR